VADPGDRFLAESNALDNSLGILDSILFTNLISRENKLKAWVDTDLFVRSFFPGFLITFLETCIIGVSIVITTLGDNLEWIICNEGLVNLLPHFIAEIKFTIISNGELRELTKNA
jgi:hypothetical protein